MFRIPLRVGSYLLALLISVLVAGACLVLFPPTELLRRAVVTQLRAELGLAGLDIGALDLRLRRAGWLELRRVQLGAPPGYELPLLTSEAVRLHYDLTELSQRKLRIGRLELVRPVVRIEQRAGKPNWQALLERLSPPTSAGEAASQAADPEQGADPTQPPDLDVQVDGIAVERLSAYVDRADQRLVLDAFDLRGQLRHGPNGTQGKLTLSIAPRHDRTASLALRAARPEPVEALLDTRVRLEVELSRLQPLAVRGGLELDVTSRRLESRFAVQPLHLVIKSQARYDQRDDSAELETLSLRLNDHDLVDVSARVDEPQGERGRLSLRLERLALPLDLLAPYLRLFAPQLTCGGTVRLVDLSLKGALPRLGQQLPGALAGRIELDGVWADLSAPGSQRSLVAFDGLTGEVRLGASAVSGPDRPRAPGALLASLPDDLDSTEQVETGPLRPAIGARVKLGLRSARFPGGRVAGLELDATAAADLVGLDPRAVALRLRLRLPQLRYHDPSLGHVRGSLRLEGSGHAAPQAGDATLERLSLLLDRRVRLHARGTVQGYGDRALRGQVSLAPLRLSTLVAQLPSGLRAKLPLRKVAGRLGIRAHVSGRRPAEGASIFAWPLRIKSHLELTDGGFDQLMGPDDQRVALRVRGLQGRFDLSGTPRDLQLEAKLQGRRVAYAQAGLALRGLSLPVALQLRRGRLNGRFGLSVASLAQRHSGAAVRQKDLALEGTLRLGLPLQRLIATGSGRLGRAEVAVDGRLGSLRLRQPGLRLAVEAAKLALQLEHEPGEAHPLRGQLRVELADLHERVLGVRARDAALVLGGRLTGVRPRLPETAIELDAAAGSASLGLTVASLRHPSLFRQLEGARLDLDLGLEPGGPLDVRRFEARAPSYGLRLAGKARLQDPWADLGGRGLPAFEASLDASLDNPKTPQWKRATALTRQVRSSGKLGLVLKLASLDQTAALAEGRLVAKDFYLWSSPNPQQLDDDGGQQRWRRSHFELRNLEADVPLSQRLQLELSPFRLTIPPPQRSIFGATAVSSTYPLVRPFTRRQANLTLDGVKLTDQLLEGSASQRRVVSQSVLPLGKAVLDLAYADGTLRLDQLYVKLFDGDLLGRLELQLARLDPLNLRLATDLQLTEVDLAYLDAAARRRGESTPISAQARLKYEMARRYASGRVLLTELSMKTLDKLLVYLDPHGLDESVQANRRLLSAWYTRAVDPEVERVSVWMDHSQLNLDIRLGAIWPFGAILRRALSRTRIRRLSIKPFLPAPAGEEQTAVQDAATARRPVSGG